MIRKDDGSSNSLFLSCQMGLSDGAFFMIKHTLLPNGNHPILSPVCPMGVRSRYVGAQSHSNANKRFYGFKISNGLQLEQNEEVYLYCPLKDSFSETKVCFLESKF